MTATHTEENRKNGYRGPGLDVTAPVGGVILQKYVERGQIIASGVSNSGLSVSSRVVENSNSSGRQIRRNRSTASRCASRSVTRCVFRGHAAEPGSATSTACDTNGG